MKRILLFLFVVVTSAMAMAEVITPEQALEQAQSFISKREADGTRPRRAPGTAASRLTMTGQISGLYVFNVAADGGFVIVSNDDSTRPILGYSDSGNIDINNIPQNMRAWLQGYADEIAWAQKHPTQQTSQQLKKAPRRIGTHSTTAIEPLVKSTWNQGEPFNNLCPTYDGSNKSATGCVATAMAQVMNYHEWPTAATQSIPGYTTDSHQLSLSSLDPVTFDWNNMLDSYPDNGYNDTQATAVATLLQYCGWSVQMDYGPESGATTSAVADALIAYFDYNSNTTQCVIRSFYTYAKWTDLIYHELSQNRPVVYGGSSSGGGHEFVCDGYKYENETDFFHINWGWGGMSDEYFVLSALDPDQQGIGGSTSNDGFHYGQDAVIGIQPSTGTGTVANITPNTIKLAMTSMTLSSNTTYVGFPVDVTLSIKNNSSDDYDGDIYLGLKLSKGYSLAEGNNFSIPAGETRDCTFSFNPSEAGSYDFVFFFPNVYGSYSTNGEVGATLTVEQPSGLTVYDGTDESQEVPAYIFYFDEYTRSQFVIPASDLTAMNGNIINALVFYTTADNTPCTTMCPVDVYVKEVDYTSINAFETKESSTIVYQGKLTILRSGSGGVLTIPLTTPYAYGGGNLMIGIENTTDDGFDDITFLGQTVNGASVAGSASSLAGVYPTQQNFIPKTLFMHEPPAIEMPSTLTATNVTTSGATLTWSGGTGKYNVEYKKVSDADWTVLLSNTTQLTYTFTNLDIYTDYQARVQSVDASDATSHWRTIDFSTPLADDMCQISLKLTDGYGDGWNDAAIQVVDVLTSTLLGTFANTSAAGKGEAQTYYAAVPNDRDIQFQWVAGSYDSECSYVVYDVNGDEIFSGSGAMNSSFTHHVNCNAISKPKDLLVSNVNANAATITWTGTADSYELRYRVASGFRYGFETAEPWAVDDFPPCSTYDGDGTQTYTFSGWSFTNQGYTGACIAFNNDNNSSGSMVSHSGNAFGMMMNPNSGAANDWFILPEITIQDGYILSFWAREITSNYGNEIINVGVYGDTDGTFSTTLADNVGIAGTVWQEYKYDLSAYVGQTVRLAINCVSNDVFGFMFDDIYVGNPNDDSGWTTVADATSPYSLTGLAEETLYEVQVRGKYVSAGYSAWTQSATFTTNAEVTLANVGDNTNVISTNNGKTCSVTLANRTLYKDGKWNTICLPFDVTLADSPLAGATARTVTAASISGTTLNMTFGDAVDVLQAGTPYIIKWATGSDIVNPVFEGVQMSTAYNSYDNGQTGDAYVGFIGTYQSMQLTGALLTEYANRVLLLTGNNQLRYAVEGVGLGAQRAFFLLGENASSVKQVTSFSIDFGDDVTTGIISVDDDTQSGNGLWYSVDGRAYTQKPTTKGIYINNGKKLIIK